MNRKPIIISIISLTSIAIITWINIPINDIFGKDKSEKISFYKLRELKNNNIEDREIKKENTSIVNSKGEANEKNTNFGKKEALTVITSILDMVENNQDIDIDEEKQLLTYLKMTNDEDVYNFIFNKIINSYLGKKDYSMLAEYSLSLLAEIDTNEASEVFFNIIKEDIWYNSSAIYSINESISKITREGKHKKLYQEVFSQIDDENPFIFEISYAISKNAEPEQIIFLMNYIDNSSEYKSEAAKSAMNKIYTESLVPNIAVYLTNNSTEKTKKTALYSLANMGQYEATSALIQWSSKQDVSQKIEVKSIFNTALKRSPSAKRAIEKEINSHVFISEEIKKELIQMSKDQI